MIEHRCATAGGTRVDEDAVGAAIRATGAHPLGEDDRRRWLNHMSQHQRLARRSPVDIAHDTHQWGPWTAPQRASDAGIVAKHLAEHGRSDLAEWWRAVAEQLTRPDAQQLWPADPSIADLWGER